MTIELAAPPPLQIAAAPNSPDLRRWVKVTTMREPEELYEKVDILVFTPISAATLCYIVSTYPMG